MNDTHLTTETVSDYVLGLLDLAAQRDVARHLATCTTCRAQVQRERALARLVHDAVDEAIRPKPNRLHQLMPHTPAVRHARQTVRRMVAVTALLLAVFLGNLGLLHSTGPVAYASGAVSAPRPALAQTTPVSETRAIGTPAGGAAPVTPTTGIDAAPVPIPTPATPVTD